MLVIGRKKDGEVRINANDGGADIVIRIMKIRTDHGGLSVDVGIDAPGRIIARGELLGGGGVSVVMNKKKG